MSGTHAMGGFTWERLRKEILRIAREDKIDEEELLLISSIPYKMPSFTGDTISIEYLNNECDQTNDELLLPMPEWCKDVNADIDLDKISYYFGNIDGLTVKDDF